MSIENADEKIEMSNIMNYKLLNELFTCGIKNETFVDTPLQ